MNEDPQAPVADAPVPEAPQPIADSGSLSEHEAQFGNKVRRERERPAKEPAPAAAAQALGTEAPPASEAQAAAPESATDGERDPQGRFKPRHRAASQQATPADTPRIAELTAKWRQAEERERALLAERETWRRPPAAPEAAARPEPSVTAPTPAPSLPPDFPAEPALEDFREQPDPYGAWVKAHNRWSAKAELTLDRLEQQQQAQAQTAKQREQQQRESFSASVEAARAKHADFDAVAFSRSTPIPPKEHGGALMHAVIEQSPHGAELLYYLHANPDEVKRLASLSVWDQTKALALIEHGFDSLPEQRRSSSRVPAAPTGSVAAPVIALPAPRPPNPVRTGPQRAEEPDYTGDESIREHESRFGPRRVRR